MLGRSLQTKHMYIQVKVHLVLREWQGYRELVGGGAHWRPGGCPNLFTGILVEEDPLIKVSLCQHVQLILSSQRFPGREHVYTRA